MRVPNAEHASIPEAKITRYLLNFQSEKGRSKAKYFIHHGYSLSDWKRLEHDLLWHVQEHEVMSWVERKDEILYAVEGDLELPDGEIGYIRSVWKISRGEENRQLASAYPHRRKKTP